MSKLLIGLIILIILFLYNLHLIKENFSDKDIKIGIIIPITSNKRNYKNIDEIDFFKIVLPSFLKYFKNKNYEYCFYLGYDDDDLFYINNKKNIINTFNKITSNYSSKINIQMLKIDNKKGKLGEIWSILAQRAVDDNCEYLYQMGDDIEFKDSKWEDQFINKLKDNNNIGVAGPTDINNKKILTQSFVHKTHLKIFNTYYPKNIVNWSIDRWISDVYKPDHYFMFSNIKVNNKGGTPRYKIVHNERNFIQNIVDESKKKLSSHLKNCNK